MKRILIHPFVAVIILLMAICAAAQNTSDFGVRLKEAQHKQIDGDLPAAIKMYQDIVSLKSADHATKAKALLGLASCLETQGKQAQAQAVYEQIIKEYGDQPLAVQQAQVKLAAFRPPTPPPTPTMRKIEFGDAVQNVVATDGQRAVYWDSAQRTLYSGDIKGKDRRIVFQGKRSADVFVSRDLTMAFLYFPRDVTPESYAIVKTDGTDYREFTLMQKGTRIASSGPSCLSWSWDNRYLVMCKTGAGGVSHLLRVSVADGEVMDVLGDQTAGAYSAAFSPDNRFIAYSEIASEVVRGPGGRVYIIPTQGGDRQFIAEQGLVRDWTHDGRYLLIAQRSPEATISSGVSAIKTIAMAVRNGQPAGEPLSINAPTVGLMQTQTLRNGTIIIRTTNLSGAAGVFRTSMNAEGRLGAWQELNNLNDLSFGIMDWSPDGQQIVYIAGTNSRAVRMRNLVTNEDREVYRSNGGLIVSCLWARQQPKLFCAEMAENRGTDIVSIEFGSGRTARTSFAGIRFLRRVTADDRTLIMIRAGANPSDAPSPSQWEIGSDPASETPARLFQSDDGRWIYRFVYSNGRRQIVLLPTSGDGDSVIVQTRMQRDGGAPSGAVLPVPIRFTSDSKWLVYQDKDVDGRDGLYRISTSGGSPERLGDYPTSSDSSALSISADGRQFLVTVDPMAKPPEFWVAENLIPAPKAVAK